MLFGLPSFVTNIAIGSPTFSIASLSLTGYWEDASYSLSTGGIWLGSASAGASNGRNLSEVTNFPAKTGVGLSGYPDFDGTNDKLESALTLNDFFSVSGWSAWVLFYADTAPSDAGATQRYNNAQFFGGANYATICMGFSTAGVHLLGGAVGTERVVACGTGGWHLAQGRYDGTNLELRVDSGAWSSVAAGATNPTFMTDTLRFGANYALNNFIDGKQRNMGFAASALSYAQFDNVKASLNAATGLTL